MKRQIVRHGCASHRQQRHDPDRRPGHPRPRETEDDPAAVGHEEAEALVAADAAVDRIGVVEHVGRGDGEVADRAAGVGRRGVVHRLHHRLRGGLVDACAHHISQREG